MVVAIILFVFLGFSVLMNIGSFFSSMGRVNALQPRRAAGPRLEEVLLEEKGGRAKIAVIRIEGIITSRDVEGTGFNMVDVVKAQLKRAEEDHRVEAVVLKVDSPGGEVLASDDINQMIADFQTSSSKPVVACMGGLAASGGYYVSAPCRWIVANELTITGSIGVIMGTWNYRGLMDKVGVRPYTYKSGQFKDMLSGSREPTEIPEEERKMVQGLIDETYKKFQKVVNDGRTKAYTANKKDQRDGRQLADNWREYADGRILSGKEAHDLGFVDSLGSFEDAVEEAADIANLLRYDVIEYRLHYDLSDLFRMFGTAEPRGQVKVDLGIDMPKLEAGRMYFLSPTYLH